MLASNLDRLDGRVHMETWKLGLVGRLWMLRLVRHGGGSAAEKVGGPAGGKPRCHLLLLFSKSMRLWGSEKERDKDRVKGVSV